MKIQHYANHRRLLFTYHGLTFLPLLALIIGSIRNLIYCDASQVYAAALLVLVSFLLLSLYLHTRIFALKAQDRAIRAEENLRYFILTGKRLDTRLTLRQVIALRFASDEELPGLVEETLQENLKPDAIKKSVRNWRPDTYRV